MQDERLLTSCAMLSMIGCQRRPSTQRSSGRANAHRSHRPVSAISRGRRLGRRGRWWRARAPQHGRPRAAAVLRNPGDRFVTVMYGFYLGL